ncbi:c-type cytochrome biogenesis protein CcmI [Frigidibacter sp. RF13]|uniref:c-type cytochrome biogenesis protein CcmI n=1 Tax=Frigidibacter sp. RF13 TaxID=2997340 RepID=UPI002271A46B|nr:c-type cytochrome biogenesis protein CcmI [Frigidibacter sp. RF13]MCY1127088.1 c-type cytochrome biogenesis protein CcmI [Frigidibacter sp. RF13]
MVFWLIATALAALIPAALWLSGRRVSTGEGPASDLALYKQQLGEVDRDLARGTIGPEEAEALRLEIKRRILALDRQSTAPVQRGMGGMALPLAATMLAILGSIFLYQTLGVPTYPDLPHAGRIAKADALKAGRPSQAEAEAEAAKTRPPVPAPDAQYADLMDQLRAAVAARPEDVQGLRLLAENERKLGNLSAAARAEEQLVAALGAKASSADFAALADALVLAAGGTVTAEAEQAVLASLKADPSNGTARFYAGLVEAQTGRPDRAFPLWRDLLADSPAEAPWVPFIEANIEGLAAAAGADYQPPRKAAPAFDPDQAEMIAGMVNGLEARLQSDGGSPEEWAQLVRALGVLKEADRARAAWALAQAALAGDLEGLAMVRAEAQAAGVAE